MVNIDFHTFACFKLISASAKGGMDKDFMNDLILILWSLDLKYGTVSESNKNIHSF